MEVPRSEDKPVLSIEETRRILGLGRSSAYNAVASGEIPTIRIGRLVKVPTAGLRRMLQLDD
jgi:excisionase family DNA binding protein